MKRWITYGMVLLFLCSCSSTQRYYAIQTSMIGIEASVLKTQYKQVERLVLQEQEENAIFTAEEWNKLMNVDATIDILILKYDAILKLDTVEMDLAEVHFMWQLAVEGYTQGSEVIQVHWDEFEPSTKILLNAFDAQAGMTTERISELLNNPDNSSINQTLVLIASVLSITIKMLGVAVL